MAKTNSTRSAADNLRVIERKVHETFCILECASTALQKAEDEDDRGGGVPEEGVDAVGVDFHGAGACGVSGATSAVPA